MLENISRRISRLSVIAGYVAGVLLCAAVALILSEVISRNIFHHSLLSTTELTAWLLVGITFMGLAYTLKERRHIRITLISSRLSQRAQTKLTIILCGISLLWVTYLAMHFWQGVIYTYKLNICGTSLLAPPMYPLWAVAFIGCCILSLQFIGIMFEEIVTLKQGKETNSSDQR